MVWLTSPSLCVSDSMCKSSYLRLISSIIRSTYMIKWVTSIWRPQHYVFWLTNILSLSDSLCRICFHWRSIFKRIIFIRSHISSMDRYSFTYHQFSPLYIDKELYFQNSLVISDIFIYFFNIVGHSWVTCFTISPISLSVCTCTWYRPQAQQNLPYALEQVVSKLGYH